MTSESPDMRASDAERERVAETLREAVAEGRLEMDEFEQRLDATFKARTHGELVPLVRDLPAPGGVVQPVTGAVAQRKGSSAGWAARIGGTPTSSGAFAFWGGFHRKGRWTVGPKFTAFAMWGGGEIDLREANFAEREVVIRCFTIMGGMQVTVPPDLNVQVSGLGIMGGFGEHSKLDDEPDPAPDAPRVKITGFALMGGVGVEFKRSKAEKRRLQEQERLRLQKPDSGDGRKELG
ncbi:DUF1707 domain-containing protein [Streptomyces sp. NE06-03E]|uniref:DUF1707 and DUF2154 domain-containing protein n=3 Tax=Streptomyces TaxID=1883 RepID=A0A652L7X2_9ACTN|nr:MULTISPECIES: DUF1707 domain-containing protein [unclassified Streptomyces]WSS62131.1 DUF1707 domain-containing protein [Streptomyces sp. NBC_01177]WSS69153.1 DUF1707 domain-containing protein [Streptomyces sp. NBC_01175]WSS76170.1 DUF1707 domain-containing protein [Streptomyces sp. NBC_01174]MDX3059858.1 DUF1707 domain-containing protein [Streptomyces sp. NE06-03E]MDX3329398.1 DUF1707 domain-containing protein [Streptomyces sp. ME02-6979-3A]